MKLPRVLIADDTPASLALLVSVLEPHGYEILTASNGREALQLVTKAKPDVVLLDVVMPGHDGFYVCRELKAEPETRDIPVMVVTGYREAAEEALERGAKAYFLKPFRIPDILEKVRQQLKIPPSPKK